MCVEVQVANGPWSGMVLIGLLRSSVGSCLHMWPDACALAAAPCAVCVVLAQVSSPRHSLVGKL